MIETPFFELDFMEEEEDQGEKFYGVTVGRVVNLADPERLGRVQVRLPFIDSLDLSPWARVALPMAGRTCGTYFIPQIGDEVLVAFEQGDVNVPYIIGCLWNMLAPPPLLSPLPEVRAIRTLGGNQIVFQETPPTISIQTGPTPPIAMPTPPSPTGPHTTVELSPRGVQIAAPAGTTIIAGSNLINVSSVGVGITSGPNSIVMDASGIKITSAASITIEAPVVKIN